MWAFLVRAIPYCVYNRIAKLNIRQEEMYVNFCHDYETNKGGRSMTEVAIRIIKGIAFALGALIALVALHILALIIGG